MVFPMKLLSAVVTLVVSLGLATAASADELVFDGSGILTGAAGVNVGGTAYDVVFFDTTCLAAFNGCDSNTDFTFPTLSAANTASQALLDQVFLNGRSGNFDSIPLLTFGCETVFGCSIWTPYGVGFGGFLASFAFNEADSNDFVYEGFAIRGLDFGSQGPGEVFAVWTPAEAAVPEPTTASLVGLGLAVMGIRRWRQRRRA
jgi:hypothetical protein